MAKIDLLSAARVKSEKRPGDYLDGRGLYLQVRNETSKSWLLKFALFKRPREMGLGSAFDFTLAEAREKRDALRKLIKQGIDPIEQRRIDDAAKAMERAKAITFKEACARYIAANRAGWKNIKHAGQWEATLKTYAYPLLGALPVQAIDTALVMKVLDPVWSTKSETASRVRGRIETVIDAAKARGEYAGENPARWKGHLENLLPKRTKVRKVRNHPALAYADLPAFMQDLRQRDGIAAAALEFQILTTTRPGNALGARWSEIDRKAAVWTIAGQNMKGGQEHKVPLSEAALAVLDRMEKIANGGEFVFYSSANGRALSDAASGALIDRMNETNAATGKPQWIDPQQDRVIVPHGFRSTFRDWAAERGYPDAVAEAALAHVVSDAVIAAYKRTTFFELRKKMMDDWATFAGSDSAKTGDNVFELRAAQ
ncbi:integrase arm-type DNA-binding domain-containing protein [Bradyrhizobium sp. SSUT77]|uniref:tyrosine-type recombinase/integrase n=1 Tax=Bradyrhizobium sp. SSUT77 TaxID=3040603 RepID=UPI00244757B5|nr:integrase arm-type DNA-binding domain-containing protein [Bradyrhizobium sp. SSUT77]MDH2343252.1 tyrosine-type recombinase/integrase [Bradyrhizobium sp. SSUT77]